MEREVAAMATQLESSVGLKRKKHIRGFADDFRHVELYGGFVEVIGDHLMEKNKVGKGSGDGGIIELPKTKDGKGSGDGGIIELPKTKDGKGSGDGGIIELPKTKNGKGSGDGGIIELPKTNGGEAESGSKEEGSGSKEGAKPVKRTKIKTVKYKIDKSSKALFDLKHISFHVSSHDEAYNAALRRYLEASRNIHEQLEAKGYAYYEREEVTDDDEEDPDSV